MEKEVKFMQLIGTAEYKGMDIKQAFKTLDSGIEGLTETEASNRTKQFGYNEVVEKKKSIIIDFFARFWGPIPWLLEIAVFFCWVLGDHADGFLIFLLLLMNVVIGFINDNNSQKALELLKKKLSIDSRVLRNGKISVKPARELVPGDVITIRLGDVVPADVKVIEGKVSVDQSALTGESLPIEATEGEILYTSSIIKRGEAKCIVINTGTNTYFGKTVSLVNIAKPQSRQEKVMLDISRYMIYLGALAFVIVLWHAYQIDTTLKMVLTFAVLFIGGGIPVALPIMFTVSQATGAGELAKRGILVTRLDAIENAASVEVLCLDKTGTITKNELEVSEVVPLSGSDEGEVLLSASLASNEENMDVIDNTIFEYCKTKKISWKGFKKTSFKPFDPSTKRTEAVVEVKGKKGLFIKGAPQIVLSLCATDKKLQTLVSSKVDEFSRKGCRALGIAKSDNGKSDSLEFIGLLALADPLRPDSKAMISEIKNEGVKPKMLTGDNMAVATEIAGQAAIGNNLIRMNDVKDFNYKEKAEKIYNCDGIAEIYPEDKFSIVKMLQSLGYMVGMTGDGVNDAPALKQAEMGVAVSNATDVAKAAASMVILEPGTRVIIEAIHISRQIYQRMLTWAINKITKSIQFLILLTLGFFWFEDVIVSITGLLVLVFINDFLTLTLATDNAPNSANPNKWNLKNLTISSFFLALLYTFLGIWLIYVSVHDFKLDLKGVQTIVLLYFVYTSLFRVFIVRERKHFWSSVPSNGVILTIGISTILFTIMALYGWVIEPLPAYEIMFTMAACAVFTLLLDFPKYYLYQKLGI